MQIQIRSVSIRIFTPPIWYKTKATHVLSHNYMAKTIENYQEKTRSNIQHTLDKFVANIYETSFRNTNNDTFLYKL